MTMIEKVARAICRSSTGDEKYWDGYIDRAKVAIEAMREPFIEAMATEGGRKHVIRIINAALKE